LETFYEDDILPFRVKYLLFLAIKNPSSSSQEEGGEGCGRGRGRGRERVGGDM
jgi:hypothetical protein